MRSEADRSFIQTGRLYSPDSLTQGMLSSGQIRQCLEAGLLLKGWDQQYLCSATYNMRLGMFSCWYVGGLRVTWPLGKEDDKNRDIHRILTFRPNSLTFITTLEEFLMPCDMIARFNLLGRWVRKGLLLGTAPIVDPEFTGRLLIPIHNFSTNAVQIEFGEALIAVEFTKTLPVTEQYVPNADPQGSIQKYLELTGVVESSVSSALSRNQKLFDEIRSRTKIFSIAGGITLFLLICSTMTLMLNIFNLAENARKSAAQAQMVIDTYAAKNEQEFREYRKELMELEFSLNKLKEELATRK